MSRIDHVIRDDHNKGKSNGYKRKHDTEAYLSCFFIPKLSDRFVYLCPEYSIQCEKCKHACSQQGSYIHMTTSEHRIYEHQHSQHAYYTEYKSPYMISPCTHRHTIFFYFFTHIFMALLSHFICHLFYPPCFFSFQLLNTIHTE